jgi:4-diphosphocytidyl-2-C-methyl-D-erythritol kinase
VIDFSYAKINIGLHVISKRADDYHNLETIFVPTSLYDVVEIVKSEEFKLFSYGNKIPGELKDNLCVKAFQLIKEKYSIPNVHIHLLKRIPHGAGLGGGSSNAASCLKLLNTIFDLRIPQAALINMAKRLGADCAYFIHDRKILFAEERGDVFQTLHDFSFPYKIIIIKPSFSVSTKEAFAGLEIQKRDNSLLDIVKTNPTEWKYKLQNDFETSLLPKYPLIKEIKDYCYNKGAIYASLSGSGSAIFALFKDQKKAANCMEDFPYKDCTIFSA